MLIRAATALALLLAPAAALAEARSATFLDLAGRLPAALLSPEPGSTPAQIHFADHAATSSIVEALPVGADPGPVERYGAYARLQTPLILENLDAGLSGAWEPLVGFGPMDIQASLVVKAPPDTSVLLRLADGMTERVAPALAANGYVEETRDSLAALVSNPDDFGVDLATRNPDNPFGGMLGAASRVALDGSMLAQANNWPALLGLMGKAPQGHSDLPALAAVLDRPEWGDAVLVQATLWPDQTMLARAPGGGIPPWDLGMAADLAEGAQTITLVAFTYPDRASAEAAAAHLDVSWDRTPIVPGRPMSDLLGVPAEVEVTGEGPFVTLLTLRAPSDTVAGGFPANGPFHRLLNVQARGDLTLFGPA